MILRNVLSQFFIVKIMVNTDLCDKYGVSVAETEMSAPCELSLAARSKGRQLFLETACPDWQQPMIKINEVYLSKR